MEMFGLIVLFVFLFVEYSNSQTVRCHNIGDCSYNGVCKNNICECFPQWKGNHCASLNIIPGDKNAGLQSIINDQKVSSWGGGVVKDSDGIYHMIASEMSYFCGIHVWLSNSIVIHANSSNPTGKFERISPFIEGIFSHEPNVVKALDTNEYVIYFTNIYPPATYKYPCQECENGATNDNKCPTDDGSEYGRNWDIPLPTKMVYSKNMNGPWSDLIDINTPSPSIDSNLACYIYPNGSLVGLGRGSNGYFLTTAKNWKNNQTYNSIWLDAKFPDGCCGEDPFIWYDKRYNVLHAIWHFGGWGNPYGIHTYSINGGYDWNGFLNFNEYPVEYAYTQYVYYNDGTNITMSRCERPHLILDDDGYTPIALTNGAEIGPDDYTFTLLRPINQN